MQMILSCIAQHQGSVTFAGKVKARFNDCKLELNQEKSKIVYCRSNQKRQPPFKVRYQKFDFLGYTFKPRVVKERGKIKLGF
jgi:RNA-directed DNA polymerase